jgi:chorismate synthase
MTLDGIPAGLPIDLAALNAFLARRAPGQGAHTTTRKEADIPEFLSGIVNDHTCGAPIAAMIRNENTRSADYNNLMDCPRPGHADYTAQIKYKGFQDIAGGGHFSGRLTAPLCIAGGLCKQWLEAMGISITAHISVLAGVADEPIYQDWTSHMPMRICDDFPVLNKEAGERMKQAIADAKADCDSVGGIIECIATGLPAGWGDPMFGGMESRIASIVYGIPAVKGIDFGSGFSGSYMRGSENNDSFAVVDGKIVTETNYAGGILGGITNGMPLIFTAAIKPTASIAKLQQSVSLSRMTAQELQVHGRHDPCIVPRAVPVIEAAAAIAIYDAYLASRKDG